MKKALFLAAFAALSIQLKAQNSVLVKMKVMPNHDYSSTEKIIMSWEASYEGEGPAMDKIRASGQKMPVIMQTELNEQSEMKTGAITVKNEFPVSVTVQSAAPKETMNGQPVPDPKEAPPTKTMQGKCLVGGMPLFDPTPPKPMGDLLQDVLKKQADNMMTRVDFPTQAMKVGDTFTCDLPFTFSPPIGSSAIEMNMKVVYKLLSIAAGKADFDVSFTMAKKPDADAPGSLNVDGKGTGKISYEIASSYPSFYSQNMEIDYTTPLPRQQLVLKNKVRSQIEMQTSIK